MSFIEQIRASFSTSLVYGDPVEVDGMIVIPAGRVGGGGGGGGGGSADGDQGEGAGFGLVARPVGAWVISDGRLRWRPAIDVTRLVLGGYLVAVAYFVTTWLTARVGRR
jgi:uncharacterized spore protein YtfJ